MIGGGSKKNKPEDRPYTPPPSPSPPPIAPTSSPLQPIGGLGRRLLGSIRALLPAPSPAAAAPKIGLGLLLHLRTDHPSLRPTPSVSLPLEEDAVAGRADGGSEAGAGLHSPVNKFLSDGAATPATKVMFRQLAATKQAPDLPKPPADNVAVEKDRFFASDEPGASGEQNLVGEKGKVVEQQGAADTQGTPAKDVQAAGVDLLRKALQQCTRGQLIAARNDEQEQDVVNPGDATTCCDIAAAEDDQEKVGSAENVDDAMGDQKVVEQGAIARKGVSTHGTAVDHQKKAVVSATANGCDMGTWRKKKVKLPYPQRPGKLNCPSYISTGTCSLGFSCQLHHPPPIKAKLDSSWFPYEQGSHGVAEILELNHIGLPIREGARNCTHYMRSGACRYGKHCHFNHPEHVIDAQLYAPKGWEDSVLQLEKSSDHHTTVDDTSNLKKSSDDTSHLKKSTDGTTVAETSPSKKSSDHATLDGTSYSKKSSDHATLDDTSSSTGVLPPNIFRMLLPPQKVPDSRKSRVIPVKKDSNWSCTSDDSDGCCSADSSDGPLCKQEHANSSDGALCKQEHVDYPERPGRPECPFYMKFGDCKFGSACKYHHSEDKYPERPGEPECLFYMKTRFCKFGAQCRFNHPKDSNPTAQSPTNAKKYVATNEHRKPTRITLEHHMPQQLKYPERPGQPDCRYYLQFGKCKFLSACIFHHPRDVLPSGPAHSDQVGPETDGMPECPFYMKRGRCHFGSACEFRHPKDICSTTEGTFGHRTGSTYDDSTRSDNAAQQREETMYPERPGEPECVHYMKHGSCRFQMNCKYHHPAIRLSRKQ